MSLSMEQRLDRIEARHEIRALKMHYARLCDAGYPAKELGALFVEDCVWDGGEAFGRYNGRAEIEAFFASTPDRVPWAMHYVVSGDITVDDDLEHGHAYWYLWQPMTLDGQAVWLIAKYEDRYVKTADGWRYADLKLDVQAVTPFDKGWVSQPFPDGP